MVSKTLRESPDSANYIFMFIPLLWFHCYDTFFLLLFLPLNLACICCALCNAASCKVIGPNYKISAGNCIQRFCFNQFEEILVSLSRPQLHKVEFLESEDSQTGPDSQHYQAAAFNTLDLPLKWLSAAMTHSATALILLAEN